MGEGSQQLGMKISESIKQKAKNTQQDARLFLQRFAMERFLVRLGMTDVNETMMLKGGMLWHLQPDRKSLARTTVDLDVHFFDLDKADIDGVMRSACAAYADDGAEVTITKVKDLEHAGEHGGLRYVMQIMFGRMRTNFHVDIGFGGFRPSGAKVTPFNSVHPKLEGGAVLMAPLEYQMAEKVHAIVKHGENNTRMKDFADLYAAASQSSYDEDLFKTSLAEAFENSGDPIPDNINDIPGLSQDFKSNREPQFLSYLQSSGYGERVPADFDEVMDTVRSVVSAGIGDCTPPKACPGGKTA